MKDKNFLIQEFTEEVNLVDKPKTTSSLLIPEKLIPVFNRIGKNRTRSALLKYLIKRYKPFYNLGLLKISNRCKTQFQAKGQNLKRFCLKPENEDWVELSVLANGIGCTRTLLFSILLELEQRGIGCFFSYPPIFKEIYSTFSNPIYSFFKIDKDKVLRRILKFIRD